MLNSLTIRQLITALCAAPLAALLLIQSVTLISLYEDAQDADRIAANAELAPTISALVHELQKERGQTAGFIGSKGGSFADTIGGQRQLTDDARMLFEKEITADIANGISSGFTDRLAGANARLVELAATRKTADDLAINRTTLYKKMKQLGIEEREERRAG